MVDDYMDSSHPSVRICYFFFNGHERNDLAAAMCSVLHQLFSQRPHLLRFAMPLWKKKGDKLRQEVKELWHIFVTAALAEASCKTVCIFDALDECREADQVRLIGRLDSFRRESSSSNQDAWLKFLVTSRPYDLIQVCFRSLTASFPHLHLKCEEYNDQIQKEIDVVVRIRVKELAETAQLSQNVARRLEQQLLQMKNRTYLWLQLVLDDIRYIPGSAEKKIRMISSSLRSVHPVDAVYERILSQVPSSQVVTVRAILQIIIAARRPLTTGEMGMALGIALRPKSRTTAEAIISPQDLERKLQWPSGLFVYTNDSKVCLIHQTAREFLIRREIASQPGSWYSLNLQDAETLMARICLQYLSMEDLKTNRSQTSSQGSSLLEYSAVFWPDHVRSMNSSPNLNQEVNDPLEQLYNTKTQIFSLWFPIFWKAKMPHIGVPTMDSVHLAAFNGHEKVLRRLIARDNTHINTPDSEDSYPVTWSALNGHDNVVRILLDRGADVNAQGGYYGNALQAACFGGHDNIVHILLDRGADVNAQGGCYGNALQAACFGGHDNIVHILLDRGADANAQGGSYGTALQAACYGGHNNVVRVLLDRGADVNAACFGGHVVQILLDRGADVNAQGGSYGTALYAACFGGHDNVVHILLDRGADVNAQGEYYGTALQAACYGGHDNIVHILLDRGADVNAQGGCYGTALYAACCGGHNNIVRVLLDHGANVNAACFGRHNDVIWILLDRGADINAQGGSYGTALQAACFRGHDNIVHILLDRGADINAQGGSYGTALHAACFGGHDNVVRILLDRGADANAQGGSYGTALQTAYARGHDTIAQILLERGADVNAHGGSYGSVGCTLQTSIFDGENRNGARSGATYPSTMPTSQSRTKVDSQLVISLDSSGQKAGLETDQAETMSSNIKSTNEIEKDVVPDDCDAETTYSIDFTPDHSPLLYIQAFADQLARDIRNITNVSNISDISPQSLDELLKAFSWKLHGESSTPFQWEAAVTLHRKRKYVLMTTISKAPNAITLLI
jgi:ankyrin repeat protein